MKVVCARLRCQVNNAAIKTAEFSRRTINFDPKLLNGFDDWKESYLSRFRLQSGNAVEQIFIRSWTPAIYAWE